MSAAQIIDGVRRELAAAGDPDRAPAMQEYMKSVEAAVQQRRPAGHFFERIVLPQHLVSPVWTDVVEGADYAVLAPHDDDRGVEEPQLAGEVNEAAREIIMENIARA